jgi:hypothetical protein
MSNDITKEDLEELEKSLAPMKHVVFRETDKRHADLKIKLDYEKITQSDFFRMMITGYIDNDPRLTDFIAEWKVKNKTDSKRSMKIIDKDRKTADNIDKLLGVSDESDSLFDIIEDDFDI